MVIEYGQSVKTQYLIDRADLGKMCKIYVTFVTSVDKGQWHVTLVRAFKFTFTPLSFPTLTLLKVNSRGLITGLQTLVSVLGQLKQSD